MTNNNTSSMLIKQYVITSRSIPKKVSIRYEKDCYKLHGMITIRIWGMVSNRIFNLVDNEEYIWIFHMHLLNSASALSVISDWCFGN